MKTKKGIPQGTAHVCSTTSTPVTVAAAAVGGVGSRPNAWWMNGLTCGRRPVHREHRPAVREVSGNLITDMAFGAPVIDRPARQRVIERTGFGAREQ